jgi:ribosomal silencing factor RsfS
VLNDGYAGQMALQKLMAIAEKSGADLSEIRILKDTEALDYIVIQMGKSKHPNAIEYRMDGKFFKVVRRTWDETPGA